MMGIIGCTPGRMAKPALPRLSGSVEVLLKAISRPSWPRDILEGLDRGTHNRAMVLKKRYGDPLPEHVDNFFRLR